MFMIYLLPTRKDNEDINSKKSTFKVFLFLLYKHAIISNYKSAQMMLSHLNA